MSCRCCLISAARCLAAVPVLIGPPFEDLTLSRRLHATLGMLCRREVVAVMTSRCPKDEGADVPGCWFCLRREEWCIQLFRSAAPPSHPPARAD
jgi:hypothetical protein